MLKQLKQQHRMNSTTATRNVLKTRYVNAITRFNVFLISDREFIRVLVETPHQMAEKRARGRYLE